MPVLQFKGKSVIETYHHTVAHHTFEFDKKLSVLNKGQEPLLDCTFNTVRSWDSLGGSFCHVD